jgi:DNA repair exonuclease SbcCD ATPase subunit
LLGLTDVKLKQELAALVDTSLWSTAGQDVRTRDRAVKTRLTELAVEARLRREEHARAEAANDEANTTLNHRQQELEQAQRRAQEVPVDTVSLTDLTIDLELLQAERQAFVSDNLSYLREVVNMTKSSYDGVIAEADREINQLNVEIAKLRTGKNSTATAAAAVQKRLTALEPQHRNNTQLVSKWENACAVFGCSDTTIVDMSALRSHHESSMAALTSVGLRLDTTKVALSRLMELNTGDMHAHHCTDGEDQGVSVIENGSAAGSAEDACPTCGQEMPAETRDRRQQELNSSLIELTVEQKDLQVRATTSRKLFDAATALVTAREALQTSASRMHELQSEAAELKTQLNAHAVDLQAAEERLIEARQRKATIEAEYSTATQTEQEELTAAEAKMMQMQETEKALQKRIKELRETQEAAFKVRSTASAQVALAQDRVSASLRQLQERGAVVESLAQALTQLETTRAELTAQSSVLERLATVLGPRGVQNFVFQNVIEQLESITNAYLEILAEGGIQLALQNTGEEEEKIVKSVWVRSRDTGGEYRERALAQLSGGQWRRVSLALDFAFAELIRRRGVLRSNLMVMDEVLTHLDATGRESVGTVLRAMVQGPRPVPTAHNPATTLPSTDAPAEGVDEFGVPLPNAEEARMAKLTGALLGGGAYETVIVILQDLAAAELAEAFDHVDVVVKERDSSVVVLDGADASVRVRVSEHMPAS